ncbi:hypothetical protein [Deinococcus roseus]|uniref:Uncharacterized protein n=1 Tax=Deinococcus roseus TaxID=392414 RepID=A0ABQ2D327_9DEIO|nr:hypothetical protein [Deinococcus roseus]GGJ43968.1 hypothetical protein GCM10008938_32800 [Deinococcus roseus]
MKKRLLFTLMTLSPALAQGFYTEMFYPTTASIDAACTEGYADGSLPIGETSGTVRHYTQYVFDLKNPNPEGFDIYDVIPSSLQNGLGGIYNICFSSGKKLDNKPSLAALSSAPASVLVYMYAEASSPTVARDYNTVLVLKDAAGKEIARYQPTQTKEGEDFDVSCSKTPCIWSGDNIYYFNPSKMPSLKENLQRTSKLTVLMSRGRGIESFDVLEGANKLTEDHKPTGPRPSNVQSGVPYTLLSDLVVLMNKVDPGMEYITIFDDQVTVRFKTHDETLKYSETAASDYIRYKDQAYLSPEVLARFNCKVLGFEAGLVKVSCPEISRDPLTLTGQQWD